MSAAASKIYFNFFYTNFRKFYKNGRKCNNKSFYLFFVCQTPEEIMVCPSKVKTKLGLKKKTKDCIFQGSYIKW